MGRSLAVLRGYSGTSQQDRLPAPVLVRRTRALIPKLIVRVRFPSPAQREVPAQRACKMWVSVPLGSPTHTPPPLRWTGYLACERVLASSIREGRAAMASETGHAPTANETGPVTPDSIMEVARGFMAAKHLFAASSIGIFEALADGPATLAEIAARAGISERAAHISADA